MKIIKAGTRVLIAHRRRGRYFAVLMSDYHAGDEDISCFLDQDGDVRGAACIWKRGSDISSLNGLARIIKVDDTRKA